MTIMPQYKQKINISLKHQDSKCGEIYFVENNFSFVCIFCEIEIQGFLEFKLHFENLHFMHFACKNENRTVEKEYTNFFEEEILQSTNDVKKTSTCEGLMDPLSWCSYSKPASCEKSCSENPEILCNYMNLLTPSSTADAVDVESQTENLRKITKLEIEDDNFYSIDYKIDWDEPYKPAQNLLKRPYKPRGKLNACTFCDRTFRRRYQLDTHLNIHTGEKPHQCEICGRRFRALTTLQRHLNTHEKRKEHLCKFCNKKFTHRAALLSHESRHVQKRNISCDECIR